MNAETERKFDELQDAELDAVSGGFFDSDPVEPGNWYIKHGARIAISEIASDYYYYCKSDAGNGNFLFGEYVHHHGEGTDKWMFIHDVVRYGSGYSKTYVSPEVLKLGV